LKSALTEGRKAGRKRQQVKERRQAMQDNQTARRKADERKAGSSKTEIDRKL
jgi:hypothetical protein